MGPMGSSFGFQVKEGLGVRVLFLSFADFQLNLFWGLAISGRLECILWGPVFYSGVEFRALGRWLRVGLRTLDGVQCFLIVLSRLAHRIPGTWDLSES